MSHDHHHNITNHNRAFALGVLLNIGFVIVEVGYGLLANSMALIADAGHNLSDVASLLLAWGASALANKAATAKRTYGLRKITVFASLLSAVLLLLALGVITFEALERIRNPQPIEGLTIIVVAGIGVFINFFTALLFFKGQKQDLNIRGAFLHMAADAAVSLGVVISGMFILFKNWIWIDPVISLVIVAVISVSTWGLLRDSFNYAIDGVPNNIDTDKIREYFLNFDCVERLHDLHVWPLSTSENAITVHLVVNTTLVDNDFLLTLKTELSEHFGVTHSTIQVESDGQSDICDLDNSHCL
jgi:cobalt-zinc-cadmium efflux system protein